MVSWTIEVTFVVSRRLALDSYPAAVDVRLSYRSADSEKSTSRLLYSLRGSVP